jgi:putative transferase (TIGR04331 family)
MELSLLSYNYYKNSDIYFGFDSKISDSEKRNYFLLNPISILSNDDLEIIENKSIAINSLLVRKFINDNNEDFNKFRYYQFYLNPLLIYISQIYFLRLKLLEQVFKEYVIESVVITSIEPSFVRPKDTNEFIHYLFSENFNGWLNSFIFKKNSQKFLFKNVKLFSTYDKEINIQYSKLAFLKNTIKFFFRRSTFYETLVKKNKLNFLSSTSEKKCLPDDLHTSVNFYEIDIIYQLFKEIAPKSFFNKNPIFVNNLKPPHSFKKIAIFYGTRLYDDKHRKKIATYFNKNKLIISIQHGGHNYGTGKFCGFLINELQLSDLFITWGWNNHKVLKANVIPTQKIKSFFKNKNNLFLKKVIWVGTHMNMINFRIDSNPQPYNIWQYRINKLDALNKLYCTASNYELYYRPYYTSHSSLDDSTYFKAQIPKLKLFEKKNLLNYISYFSLIIIDHPGTLLNFCLANNHPIICFWNKNYFYFTDEAEKIFTIFKDVKILFDNINDLTKHLSSLDLNLWWNNKDVIKAKNEFNLLYANIFE